MGKDEEERDTCHRAKERIDEYSAKQEEEHIYHKQEWESYSVDAMIIEKQAVLEDNDVQESDVLSGKPSEEWRESAATSFKTAWADVDFKNEDKVMAEPNDDREEL